MTPLLAPLDLAGVTIMHQAGAGHAMTHGGTYPLGGMSFSHTPSGRGVITLKAGAGAFQLSGDQAVKVARGRWKLNIDQTALLSLRRAKGDCEMVFREAPPTYVSLRCRLVIGDDPRPVTVKWRGDGSQAVRLR